MPSAPAFYLPPAAPRWNGKTNGLSIAALTLSLVGCAGVISLALGVGGLVQSRRNGDKRGKVIAIVALVVTTLWFVAVGVFAGIALVREVTGGPDRDAAGAVRGERALLLTALQPGDCVRDLDHETSSYVEVVPCSEPHSSEVVAALGLRSGEAVDQAVADADCRQQFRAYAGQEPPAGADYSVLAVALEYAGRNDPDIICFAHQRSGATTGSVRR